MSRKRKALLVLILLGFGGVILQVYRSIDRQREGRIDRSALEGMLPEAVQWIRDFRRIEVRDGKKVWQIEGEEAQVLEGDAGILVRGPRASFYMEDGTLVSVRGDEGNLAFDGRELREVHLRDNVEVRVRDFVVRAENATYHHERREILAEGPVTVEGDRLRIEGRDMIVNVETESAWLRQDVRALVKPSAEAS